jgi:hypothetical protein
MADGIFMDRISGSLANWMRRAGFAAQIESQLSDCNRSAQGAKCIQRPYALHGAQQGAPCIRHNFITIARTKKSDL